MRRSRDDVFEGLDSGRVVAGREGEVLRVAGMLPTPAEWRGFLGQLTLWLGTIALAAAVIFFFAFNWDDLGRFAKFGLVEGAIVAALIAAWRVDLDGSVGKAVLLLLAVLTGALLALTGQIYQTGADTYELFAWWAVLILPWVLAGRFSPLWLFWLALLNLATFFYCTLSWDEEQVLWGLFALNSVALVAWEAAHRAGIAWLQDDWPPRLAAVAGGVMATALAIWAIVDSDPARGVGAIGYAVWLASLYGWYRHVRPDLFMLAGGVLSLVVAITVFLGEHLLDNDSAGGFLFVGLVVIGMSAGGAIWLKSVAREQRA